MRLNLILPYNTPNTLPCLLPVPDTATQNIFQSEFPPYASSRLPVSSVAYNKHEERAASPAHRRLGTTRRGRDSWTETTLGPPGRRRTLASCKRPRICSRPGRSGRTRCSATGMLRRSLVGRGSATSAIIRTRSASSKSSRVFACSPAAAGTKTGSIPPPCGSRTRPGR
jgi:hypothetical protein